MMNYAIKNQIIVIHLIVLINVFFTGCKDKAEVKLPDIMTKLELLYQCDTNLLQMDTLLYKNVSSNVYSVSRLNLFLSDFTFLDAQGKQHIFEGTWYQDPAGRSDKIEFRNLPAGNYQKLSFIVGVPNIRNHHDSLPSNLENLVMIWPTAMGGGYHFFKMEGHFMADTDQKGYALHIGTMGFQSNVQINKPFVISQQSSLKIKMDVNRIFKEPFKYDLTIYPVYSMGDSSAMAKLSKNLENAFEVMP